jgi:hypothetical protein
MQKIVYLFEFEYVEELIAECRRIEC